MTQIVKTHYRYEVYASVHTYTRTRGMRYTHCGVQVYAVNIEVYASGCACLPLKAGDSRIGGMKFTRQEVGDYSPEV